MVEVLKYVMSPQYSVVAYSEDTVLVYNLDFPKTMNQDC